MFELYFVWIAGDLVVRYSSVVERRKKLFGETSVVRLGIVKVFTFTNAEKDIPSSQPRQ